MTHLKEKNKFGYWLKHSITARMLMIAVLIITLIIPLTFIKSLIQERANNQKHVIADINKKWGGEVLIYGPILKILYKVKDEKTIYNKTTKKYYTETTTSIHHAYFFPDKLNITGNVKPEEKHYGIYKTAVYKSPLKLSGQFIKPEFNTQDINNDNILWDKTKIILKTTNLKGVNKAISIDINKNNYAFKSIYKKQNQYTVNKTNLHELESSVLNKKDCPMVAPISFNMDLDINGSEQIRFTPIGKETKIQLKSNWKTANFFGEYLPYNNDKITTEGFDAKWTILEVNRPFSQQHFNGLPKLNDYTFGVNFMIPVDEYQKVNALQNMVIW